MEAPEFLIVAIIAVLAVVQSVFGIGLLVFGTPTLLLLGLEFPAILSELLPASVAVSFAQALKKHPTAPPLPRDLYLVCLPAICAGLLLVSGGPATQWIDRLIAFALLASAVVRAIGTLRHALESALKKSSSFYHSLMGLVHGLTNLGGALLTILAAATSNEKTVIRYTIARYYLAFGIVQLLYLALFEGMLVALFSNVFNGAIALAVYLVVGNMLFHVLDGIRFDKALTVFIGLYGLAIIYATRA